MWKVSKNVLKIQILEFSNVEARNISAVSDFSLISEKS